ncbi:MAG: undecaprenyl-diphosphate phosphatase [Bacteroidetes bacterium]|nr:undecaprenyl-diphosphate phosphatase [Bacteroidota bacterium]
MGIAETLVLAVIEGLTEFLPVSSTGHMIIASSFMGIAADPFVKTFTVAIQLGAILSVLVLYWKRFLQSVNFYVKLAIAFVPAAVFGFLLNDYIDALLENVIVVAVTLVLGGVVFLFIDKWFARNETQGSDEVKPRSALLIGLFQVVAMIPGVSRSAATIIGGLTQGLTRRAAAEFSFFLAVPTMFAATAYKLFKLWKEGGSFTPDQTQMLLLGNVVAFVVAIAAIRGFIGFLSRRGFAVFGWYRIALGLVLLVIHFFFFPLTVA